jgi:hypothetical protein
MPTLQRDPLRRKRPVPSFSGQPVPPPTAPDDRTLPLFLPDSDDEATPSTSGRNPLFLPEEREEERPRKKKRRISTKTTKVRTLHELWKPRKVSIIL